MELGDGVFCNFLPLSGVAHVGEHGAEEARGLGRVADDGAQQQRDDLEVAAFLKQNDPALYRKLRRAAEKRNGKKHASR